MTVTIYRSTDASAPVLNGQAGSLLNVMDAILVNGYGSKVAAGWTKPFTDINKAVFKQGVGSNNFYINVDDSGPGLGTTKEARVRGYEAMTAQDTGTSPFPTVAQMANGVFVRKSNTADAQTRGWIAAADARTMYMWVFSGDAASTYLFWFFGEIYSFKTTDTGRCMLAGRPTENNAGISYTAESAPLCDAVSATQTAKYLARDAAGNPGSIAAGMVQDNHLIFSGGQPGSMRGAIAYNNPSDQKVYLAPIRVSHIVGGNTIRGRLRGLWQFCHLISNVSDGDTLSGTGDLSGKSFMVIKQSGTDASALPGVFVVETSNTWDIN